MTSELTQDDFGIQSPQERVQALMLKFIKRKQNIKPNVSDGFVTGTSADNEGIGDGSTAGSTGSTGQNN